jgi:hypothetical protein
MNASRAVAAEKNDILRNSLRSIMSSSWHSRDQLDFCDLVALQDCVHHIHAAHDGRKHGVMNAARVI